MFTFTDLTRLDAPALQKIMREIDTRDLALALKKSDEAIKTKLLSGISNGLLKPSTKRLVPWRRKIEGNRCRPVANH